MSGSDAKYGKRNVTKMIQQFDDLRHACRAEGTPAIQDALDKVEEHIDYAYRSDPAAIRADALREALAIAEYMANRNCTAADVARDLKRLLNAQLSPTAVDGSPEPDAGGKEGV